MILTDEKEQKKKKKKLPMPKIFSKKEKATKENNVGGASAPARSAVDFCGSPKHPSSSRHFRKSMSDSRLGSTIARDHSCPVPDSPVTEAFRIFVATWNVGGNTPHTGLNLNDFLPADDHSDIYILGFQEIVPLNAGNVLVIEDIEPAMRWLSLINQALNGSSATEIDGSQNNSFNSISSNKRITSSRELKTSSGPLFFQKPSLKSVSRTYRTDEGRRLKACNCPSEPSKKSYRESCFSCQQPHTIEEDSSDDEEDDEESKDSVSGIDADAGQNSQQRYSLIATKQMVGIFVSVWVRREIVQHIGHLKIYCVGRGIMGYLGNKGCISISMSLHHTSFCFTCSHLASGEKEGDELRRNSDVIEILKNTQFRRICKSRRTPERILEHDRIIWLGDLNYRIALSYSETKNLLEKNDWDALFEKDQLKIERDAERVFKGWNEGKIFFAPTYKYSNNSDAYAGETVTSKKKRRTPAWCDRILWHGDGIVQLSYFRGESKFSDHRPVCAAFIVEVETECSSKKSSPNMKVGAEELLPRRTSYYFPSGKKSPQGNGLANSSQEKF